MREKCRVKVESDKGNLRLRWSYQGKRKTLYLGLLDSVIARRTAQNKANDIANDLDSGNYDPTLRKYRDSTAVAGGSVLSAVALFDRFTQHKAKRINDRTLEKYKAIAVKLSDRLASSNAAVGAAVVEDFQLWLSESISPVSQKEYLGTIAACWDWGIKKGFVTDNPWRDAVRLVKVPPKQRPKPFTSNEIEAIIKGFNESQYYHHYSDFVRFLFGSGCRISEAIGLRWGHISDDCTKVWIGESLSRGVRKSTKTNRSREFRLSQSLTKMLLNRRSVDFVDCRSDDLVFPAVRGGAMDDHSFRNRAWVSVLRDAGVIYRKPYNTRHSFISHALAQGMNPVTIAQMTGHDPEILFKHYAADIQGGLQLPEIFA